MILVDSSVWVDYFRGKATVQTDRLDALLDKEPIAVGDLVLAEVLQGFVVDKEFAQARKLLTSLIVLDTGGRELAIAAAQNFRVLRSVGITVRKTVDTMIATRCIVDNHSLLYSDRDFDPFVKHLGLRSALVKS